MLYVCMLWKIGLHFQIPSTPVSGWSGGGYCSCSKFWAEPEAPGKMEMEIEMINVTITIFGDAVFPPLRSSGGPILSFPASNSSTVFFLNGTFFCGGEKLTWHKNYFIKKRSHSFSALFRHTVETLGSFFLVLFYLKQYKPSFFILVFYFYLTLFFLLSCK